MVTQGSDAKTSLSLDMIRYSARFLSAMPNGADTFSLSNEILFAPPLKMESDSDDKNPGHASAAKSAEVTQYQYITYIYILYTYKYLNI